MKRLVSVFLVCVLVLGLHTTPAFAAKTEKYTIGNWVYELSNGTVTADEYKGSDATVTLPTSVTIEGRTYQITTLGSDAFQGNERLEHVIIPSAYKVVGSAAFKDCYWLQSIRIEGNLEDVHKHAHVFINAGQNSGGLTVSFGTETTRIPDYLFCNYNAGNDYSHVTELNVAKNITEIGVSAFAGCAALENINFETGSKLLTIEHDAFNECEKLKGSGGKSTLSLPSKLRTLGVNAFRECIDLTKIVLPKSLEEMSGSVFYGDTFLKSVTIKGDLKLTDDPNNFHNTGTNTEGGYSVTFAEGVTQIPEKLFYSTFASYRDHDYAHVSSVSLPSTLKSIGQMAFYECYDLKSIDFSKSTKLANIDYCAFYATGLETVTLPSSVSNIGTHAFADCSSLKWVKTTRNSGTLGTNVFENAAEGFKLKCYYGSWFDTYAQANGLATEYLTPKQPAITKISNTSTGVKITWKKTVGAKDYLIYRKTGSGSWTKVKTTGELTFTDTKANKNGTTYQYKVYGRVNSLKSKASAAKKYIFLTKPAISSLKNVKTLKAVATWKANTKATGYMLQYDTNSSFTNPKKATIKAGTLTKTVSKLVKDETYYFRLRVYKTVSSVKYYSAWSAKKTLTITK